MSVCLVRLSFAYLHSIGISDALYVSLKARREEHDPMHELFVLRAIHLLPELHRTYISDLVFWT
ncbi:unnamed protein product [Ectocarpus sp. CCAP 1310/34]|nr:unnamed protein product [Ectocarpus sp. CCAP 1310/34]